MVSTRYRALVKGCKSTQCKEGTLMRTTKVKSVSCSVVSDSATPWTVQARTLEWVAIPFSRASSRPRDRTWVSCFVGRRFHRVSHQGSDTFSTNTMTTTGIRLSTTIVTSTTRTATDNIIAATIVSTATTLPTKQFMECTQMFSHTDKHTHQELIHRF